MVTPIARNFWSIIGRVILFLSALMMSDVDNPPLPFTISYANVLMVWRKFIPISLNHPIIRLLGMLSIIVWSPIWSWLPNAGVIHIQQKIKTALVPNHNLVFCAHQHIDLLNSPYLSKPPHHAIIWGEEDWHFSVTRRWSVTCRDRGSTGATATTRGFYPKEHRMTTGQKNPLRQWLVKSLQCNIPIMLQRYSKLFLGRRTNLFVLSLN